MHKSIVVHVDVVGDYEGKIFRYRRKTFRYVRAKWDGRMNNNPLNVVLDVVEVLPWYRRLFSCT